MRYMQTQPELWSEEEEKDHFAQFSTTTASNDTKRSTKIHDAMRIVSARTSERVNIFNRIIKCGYYWNVFMVASMDNMSFLRAMQCTIWISCCLA